MKMNSTATLVIGVGNEYRGDDGVGLIIARRLQGQLPESVGILEHSGEGAALMEAWKDAEHVIIVDAVHSGAAPGAVFRLDAGKQPMPSSFFHYSTHAFSVAEAVELGRALQQLPGTLVIYGIEGKTFEAGAALSPEIEKAAQTVVAQIQSDLRFIPRTINHA